MEVHKQKCDNPECPYNVGTNEIQADFIKRNDGASEKSEEEIRTENIIKKIFNDGCKIAPINPELQL
jgi:hypothetical protein